MATTLERVQRLVGELTPEETLQLAVWLHDQLSEEHQEQFLDEVHTCGQ